MIASSRSGKGRLLFLLPRGRGRACPARGVKGDCPLKGGRADLRAGRLAAHNERRQPAKLARSCGCLPRGGKHCSLPGFAPLNRGPTLTTPQCPAPTKASLVKGRWPEGPEGFRRTSPGCPSHPQTARNPSASLRSAPAPLLALRATSPGAGESVFDKGGFFYTTPKRGPLFGGSRFGWYRKIIR